MYLILAKCDMVSDSGPRIAVPVCMTAVRGLVQAGHCCVPRVLRPSRSR